MADDFVASSKLYLLQLRPAAGQRVAQGGALVPPAVRWLAACTDLQGVGHPTHSGKAQSYMCSSLLQHLCSSAVTATTGRCLGPIQNPLVHRIRHKPGLLGTTHAQVHHARPSSVRGCISWVLAGPGNSVGWVMHVPVHQRFAWCKISVPAWFCSAPSCCKGGRGSGGPGHVASSWARPRGRWESTRPFHQQCIDKAGTQRNDHTFAHKL